MYINNILLNSDTLQLTNKKDPCSFNLIAIQEPSGWVYWDIDKESVLGGHTQYNQLRRQGCAGRLLVDAVAVETVGHALRLPCVGSR